MNNRSSDAAIAVLAIGDEILTGRIQDSNTRCITRALMSNGLKLRRVMTVSDDSAAIGEALLWLGARHRAVVVSGGLGPTGDDVTAQAAALALNRPLQLNQEALEVVRTRLRHFCGGDITQAQKKQAYIPEGALLLPNTKGSAPGFMVEQDGCRYFFLPGVPVEMSAMLYASVVPLLLDIFTQSAFWAERCFTLLGVPESQAERMLKTLDLPVDVRVALCVQTPQVEVRLGLDTADAAARLECLAPEIRKLYGQMLVAEGDETLAEVVVRQFVASGHTLALAESCTGGWIAKQLTDVPGASAFLERSGVVYANRAKHDWLGVPADVLANQGAVSEACALAMAHGVRRCAKSDVALSVTGIAGPGGGSELKPVGTVFIALVDERCERVERFQFAGDRNMVRWRTVCTALNWLRLHEAPKLGGA